jgi:hypothetical protein
VLLGQSQGLLRSNNRSRCSATRGIARLIGDDDFDLSLVPIFTRVRHASFGDVDASGQVQRIRPDDLSHP